MTLRKSVILLLIIGACTAIFFALNFFIVDPMIVGDPCRFHTENVNGGRLFNLLYDFNSSTGYHPEPSLFNFLVTGVVGLVVGFVVNYKFNQ